jgi:hypothetical protein
MSNPSLVCGTFGPEVLALAQAAAAWSTTGTKVTPSQAKRLLACPAVAVIVDLVSNL